VVPNDPHPRDRDSKLSPFRHGWRHLRLNHVYNPNFLFIVPGIVMLVVGALVSTLVLLGVPILGRDLQIHSLIISSLLVLLGVQAIGLGLCARAYGVYFISNKDALFLRLRARFKLEHGLALAAVVTLAGVALFVYVFSKWAAEGFGELHEAEVAIVAATLVAIGAQIFFTSFLLSILGLRYRGDEP
jgi:hypothetical protein